MGAFCTELFFWFEDMDLRAHNILFRDDNTIEGIDFPAITINKSRAIGAMELALWIGFNEH